MCSLSRLPVAKNHNFLGKFGLFGVSVPTPFYLWRPNLVCYSWPIAHVYVSKFVLIGLFYRPWRRRTPIFWTSAFSDVDNWRQSEKVEHGCTSTILPLPNDIKIISVFQRLHGEIGRKKNSDVQKRDVTKIVTDRKSVTDKKANKKKKEKEKTKRLNVYRHPAGGWNPSPTKVCIKIEGLEHVLVPIKLLGSDL